MNRWMIHLFHADDKIEMDGWTKDGQLVRWMTDRSMIKDELFDGQIKEWIVGLKEEIQIDRWTDG